MAAMAKYSPSSLAESASLPSIEMCSAEFNEAKAATSSRVSAMLCACGSTGHVMVFYTAITVHWKGLR